MANTSSNNVIGVTITDTYEDGQEPCARGWIQEEDGKKYILQLYSGTASAANGTVTYVMSTANKVTDDISASEGIVGGVAIGAVTRGYLGWFQITGPHTAVLKGGGAISDGAVIYGLSDKYVWGLSSTDTATTKEIRAMCGVATEATGTTSTTTSAFLQITR